MFKSQHDVVLVSMPWVLDFREPTIQLPILQSSLKEHGMRSKALYLSPRFLSRLLQAKVGTLDEIMELQLAPDTKWLADFVFSVPPLRQWSEDELQAFVDEGRCRMIDAALHPMPVINRMIQLALAVRAMVPAFLAETVIEICSCAPKLVGFSDSFNQTVSSLALASQLKRCNPNVKIAFGGFNWHDPMGAVLLDQHPFIDFVATGDGERTLPLLMQRLTERVDTKEQPVIEGLRCRVPLEGASSTPVHVPIDSLPIPDFHDYFAEMEKHSFPGTIRTLPVEFSRGCWWADKAKCRWCGLWAGRRKYAAKADERMFQEICQLSREYQVTRFHGVDATTSEQHIDNLFHRLEQAPYDLSFLVETRATLTKEQFRQMAAGGVNGVQIGIESLSTPILKLMSKGTTLFQNIQALKWCTEFGIFVNWNYLYGIPGEDPDEYRKMAELMPRLFHFPAPLPSPLSLDRYSEYHDHPDDWGIRDIRPSWWLQRTRALAPNTPDGAYSRFDYRVEGMPDRRVYTRCALDTVALWGALQGKNYNQLKYAQGPDFVFIQDNRTVAVQQHYHLSGPHAAIYRACDKRMHIPAILDAIKTEGFTDCTEDQVHDFCEIMFRHLLMYGDGTSYVSLAVHAAIE